MFGEYIGPGDCLLSYLPLAHIFEFVFENLCLYWGATMGYGSPRTLSEANVRNCQGDIKELKPTLLIGVPAVWETVKKGIIANVSRGGKIKENVFWTAFNTKRYEAPHQSSEVLTGSGFLWRVDFLEAPC